METWAAIPGYEGHYEASDLGRVRSLPRMVNGGSGPRLYPGRIRKQSIGSHGYSVVSLSRDGIVQVCCANRLVLMAFRYGYWATWQDACHDDGNKQNNALTNLRWDTRVGNAADKRKHGTHIEGSAHKSAKLDEVRVREIKNDLTRGIGTTALAKTHGVAVETIHSIKSGKSWKHV